jgi:hypothetical protein
MTLLGDAMKFGTKAALIELEDEGIPSPAIITSEDRYGKLYSVAGIYAEEEQDPSRRILAIDCKDLGMAVCTAKLNHSLILSGSIIFAGGVSL